MLTRICLLGALMIACSPKPPAMSDGGDMMEAGDPANPPDADTSDAPMMGPDAGKNDAGHHCNHHEDDDDDDENDHHHH